MICYDIRSWWGELTNYLILIIVWYQIEERNIIQYIQTHMLQAVTHLSQVSYKYRHQLCAYINTKLLLFIYLFSCQNLELFDECKDFCINKVIIIPIRINYTNDTTGINLPHINPHSTSDWSNNLQHEKIYLILVPVWYW